MAALKKSEIFFAILDENYDNLFTRISQGTRENPNNLSFAWCNSDNRRDKFLRCINDEDEECENCKYSKNESALIFFEYAEFILSREKKIKFFKFWLDNMRECDCQCNKYCRDCLKQIKRAREGIYS